MGLLIFEIRFAEHFLKSSLQHKVLNLKMLATFREISKQHILDIVTLYLATLHIRHQHHNITRKWSI